MSVRPLAASTGPIHTMRWTSFGLALAMATFSPALSGADEAGSAAALTGRVWTDDGPGAETSVFVYEVASTALVRSLADRQGYFSFRDLPAGLYKVVAHKAGYRPAVEVVLRRDPSEAQTVELRLSTERGDTLAAEAFWEARRSVPPDILRELVEFGPERPTRLRASAEDRLDLVTPTASALTAELSAAGGVEDLGQLGEASRRSAGIGVRGSLGSMELGIRGQFEELAARDSEGPQAEMRVFDVALTPSDASAISVSSSVGEAPSMSPDGNVGVAGLERHHVAWSGRVGESGHSRITAAFVEEAHFYRQGELDPADLPTASRTWDVGGEHRQSLGHATSIEAGLRYRQRSSLEPGAESLEPEDTLDVFGRAGSMLGSRVLVEYGLASHLQGENLSLVPHGGVVVDLGRDWKAIGRIAQRFEDREDAPLSFAAGARFDDDASCREAGEACYEVRFTRGADAETFSVGAVHREFADTLRLYFSDDFFDRLQSVFVVRGDEVPELSFRMVRQITPQILATLSSNVAAGGGGIFYATDSNAYQNSIRYLVTSLDTRFQKTSTGVFLAFHHLEQDLQPTLADGSGSELEMQRLQLMLTQDLSALANIANHFAVRFNMELSRGTSPFTLSVDDELQRKLTGGISVSF